MRAGIALVLLLSLTGLTNAECKPPDVGASWNVETNSIEICSDQYVDLQGDLVIEEGATLVLRNTTVHMNNAFDGEHNIILEDNAQFSIRDKDDDKETWDDASKITNTFIPGTNYFIKLASTAAIEIKNSEITNCGYKNKYCLYGSRNSVSLTGSRIHDNANKIVLQGAGSLVEDNEVTGNEAALVLGGDKAGGLMTVRNNVFEDNYGTALEIASNENVVSDNVFKNNYVGLRITWSSDSVVERNSFENNVYGLKARDVEDSLFQDNVFNASAENGLELEVSSGNEVEGNEFYGNKIGVFLEDSEGGNLFSGNEVYENTLVGFEAKDAFPEMPFWENCFDVGGRTSCERASYLDGSSELAYYEPPFKLPDVYSADVLVNNGVHDNADGVISYGNNLTIYDADLIEGNDRSGVVAIDSWPVVDEEGIGVNGERKFVQAFSLRVNLRNLDDWSWDFKEFRPTTYKVRVLSQPYGWWQSYYYDEYYTKTPSYLYWLVEEKWLVPDTYNNVAWFTERFLVRDYELLNDNSRKEYNPYAFNGRDGNYGEVFLEYGTATLLWDTEIHAPTYIIVLMDPNAKSSSIKLPLIKSNAQYYASQVVSADEKTQTPKIPLLTSGVVKKTKIR
ncbi:right-handed parallel beta-helix repeat-containing protein [Candidatus Micrarchaeota archaeon]|nr:right-handed parallel beta-helix repeat-containing protein [Candidatus Micrarchaeota archaeon]